MLVDIKGVCDIKLERESDIKLENNIESKKLSEEHTCAT